MISQKSLIVAAFGALVFIMTLYAADNTGNVSIKSPSDMSKVKSGQTFNIEYQVDTGKNGDHLHLVINKNNAAVIRELTGTVKAGPLKAGKNEICLTLNTKSHMPTGAENCINVTAE